MQVLNNAVHNPFFFFPFKRNAVKECCSCIAPKYFCLQYLPRLLCVSSYILCYLYETNMARQYLRDGIFEKENFALHPKIFERRIRSLFLHYFSDLSENCEIEHPCILNHVTFILDVGTQFVSIFNLLLFIIFYDQTGNFFGANQVSLIIEDLHKE